jgi:hypothetical protein
MKIDFELTKFTEGNFKGGSGGQGYGSLGEVVEEAVTFLVLTV